MSFEELTDRSEVVVSGQVTRSWSDWDSEHKYIWTHHEIKVSGALKGSAASTVVVSEPGGVVGNRAMSTAGVVAYSAGEQVAVFLERMPNGYLRTTGWGQGKYTVDSSGRLHADASLRGVEILQPDQKATTPARTPLRTLEGMSVGEFRSLVRAHTALKAGSVK